MVLANEHSVKLPKLTIGKRFIHKILYRILHKITCQNLIRMAHVFTSITPIIISHLICHVNFVQKFCMQFYGCNITLDNKTLEPLKTYNFYMFNFPPSSMQPNNTKSSIESYKLQCPSWT